MKPSNGAILSLGFGSYKATDYDFEVFLSSPRYHNNASTSLFSLRCDGSHGWPSVVYPRYQRPALYRLDNYGKYYSSNNIQRIGVRSQW